MNEIRSHLVRSRVVHTYTTVIDARTPEEAENVYEQLLTDGEPGSLESTELEEVYAEPTHPEEEHI